MNLRALLAIGYFEGKLLLRGFRFWVLTAMAFGVASLFNIGISLLHHYASGLTGTLGIGSHSLGLYLQYFALSVLYSFAVIWFAHDARSKDRASRVDEVLDSRPISNLDLVAGKFLGVAFPVLMLGFLLGFFGVVSRVLPWALRGPVQILEHGVYLGFLAIPGLLCVVALVIALTELFRSRAAAVVLSTALSALVIVGFILLSKGPGPEYMKAVDFTGFGTAFLRSDLIGFESVRALMVQRAYVAAWIGLFLALAALRLRRKEGTKAGRRIALAAAGVCALAVALYAGHTVLHARAGRALRAEAKREQQQLAARAPIRVSRYDIKVSFPGSHRLAATSAATLHNDNAEPLSQAVFTLNPGLRVESVTGGAGQPFSFRRGITGLVIDMAPPVPAGGEATVTIRFAGRIETDALLLRDYLTPERVGKEAPGSLAMVLGHLPSYVGKFTFLLPDALWYPAPNAPDGFTFPQRPPTSFFTTRVEVITRPGDDAISAGMRGPAPEGVAPAGTSGTNVVWESREPIPSIPLLTGPYRRLETEVNGIRLGLYYHAGHEAAIRFFDDAGAALKDRIGRKLATYKEKTGLAYPFPSLSVVEVPYQAAILPGSWDRPSPLVQPSIVLLRETSVFTADFGFAYEQRRRAAARKGADWKADTAKVDMLEAYFGSDSAGGQIESNVLRNYWTFRVAPRGPLYPLLDQGVWLHLVSKATGSPARELRKGGSMEIRVNAHGGDAGDVSAETESEMGPAEYGEALRSVEKAPLSALDPMADVAAFSEGFSFKGRRFIDALDGILGERLGEALSLVAAGSDHGNFTLGDFQAAAETVHGGSLEEFFRVWLRDAGIPGFVMTEARAYRIPSDDPRPSYQILVKIENAEKTPGYGWLVLDTGSDEVRRFLSFGAGECKEIGIVVPAEPSSVVFAPAFARNYRGGLRRTLSVNPEGSGPARAARVARIEGVTTVACGRADEGIIVDDTDNGFRIEAPPPQGLFRFFRKQKPPGDLPYWEGYGTPRRFQRWVADGAYGRYNATVAVKAAGRGDHSATWSVPVPKTGAYEVSVYNGISPDALKSIREGFKISGRFHFTVSTSDGAKPVELDTRACEPGWNSVGVFSFEATRPAVIRLSDLGDGLVIADAVRLIPAAAP